MVISLRAVGVACARCPVLVVVNVDLTPSQPASRMGRPTPIQQSAVLLVHLSHVLCLAHPLALAQRRRPRALVSSRNLTSPPPLPPSPPRLHNTHSFTLNGNYLRPARDPRLDGDWPIQLYTDPPLFSSAQWTRPPRLSRRRMMITSAARWWTRTGACRCTACHCDALVRARPRRRAHRPNFPTSTSTTTVSSTSPSDRDSSDVYTRLDVEVSMVLNSQCVRCRCLPRSGHLDCDIAPRLHNTSNSCSARSTCTPPPDSRLMHTLNLPSSRSPARDCDWDGDIQRRRRPTLPAYLPRGCLKNGW
ncbi:hypothetical protein DFH08DRAFT_1085445 [Mycena albidolilacea]|uniref:Uncharacterized protein n=1 Tax=Mycena albidolilacea TaxID=1033008 RepID=A0AAD6ZHE2_9AGAR|nr:hypothetical protein DFH08DRAFT_1085445 [Mycena albidolilacea]